jgi:hypothetical protein
VVVVVVDIQSLTRNMVVVEVVWAAAAVDSGVVEAGTLRLVEEVVTRQVEEVTTVVTRQVEEVTSVVTLQVEEVTTVVTRQVEEVVLFLLVEVATVVPVEAAAAVVTGVAVPIARLRVPAPVLDGEYGDQLSGC